MVVVAFVVVDMVDNQRIAISRCITISEMQH
jgi:hypothetical protein